MWLLLLACADPPKDRVGPAPGSPAATAASGAAPAPQMGGARASFAAGSPTPRLPDGQHPDVVLITLDTTRADALSCYGNPRPTTPGHDALAARGTRFAWALAQSPSTLASHATVFSGLDAHGTRIVRNGYPMPDELETLAERFASRGWQTMGVIGSSALADPMGARQGFDVWDETFTITRIQRHEAFADEVTDRALAAWAKRDPAKPSFLFVHYYDAHSPYDAPEPYKHRWSDPAYAGMFEPKQGTLKPLAAEIRGGKFDPRHLQEVRDVYLGEVSWVDAQVARLLAGLDPSRTVVAIFGDHGEMFGEVAKRPFGHGADVDLPVSHVPLILAGPGVPAGAVVDDPVGLQDLPATLLALAGLPEAFGQSHDLAPLWADAAATPGRRWFLEATQPGYAGRDIGWNNVINEVGVLDGAELLTQATCYKEGPTLYGVAEGQPRLDDPARAAALAGPLDAWLTSAPPYRSVQLDDKTKEGLKALGYLE